MPAARSRAPSCARRAGGTAATSASAAGASPASTAARIAAAQRVAPVRRLGECGVEARAGAFRVAGVALRDGREIERRRGLGLRRQHALVAGDGARRVAGAMRFDGGIHRAPPARARRASPPPAARRDGARRRPRAWRVGPGDVDQPGGGRRRCEPVGDAAAGGATAASPACRRRAPAAPRAAGRPPLRGRRDRSAGRRRSPRASALHRARVSPSAAAPPSRRDRAPPPRRRRRHRNRRRFLPAFPAAARRVPARQPAPRDRERPVRAR